MQTNLLTTSSQGSDAASGGISAAIGADGSVSDLFTKLLVAQIQNQNPLEPSDPSQFVNQLTQLSQMESLQSLTQQTAASTTAMESMQVIALGAQVGSSVRVRTEGVTVGTEVLNGSFDLASASSETTLVLTGADKVEHRVALGMQAPGEVGFSVNPAALGLTPGNYGVRVDTASKESPVVQVAGTLEAVKLSAAGGIVLSVSGLGNVSPSDVTQFNGRSSTTSSAAASSSTVSH